MKHWLCFLPNFHQQWDNPWIGMLMKSIGGDTTIKKSMTYEAIDRMINSVFRQ
jgi:hypothetical protein